MNAASRHVGTRVRILLLAPDTGDWRDRLAIDYPQHDQIFAGVATPDPYAMQALHPELPDREEAYRVVLQFYGDRLGFTGIESRLSAIPDLSAAHFDNPLYPQMTTPLALHGERAETAQGLAAALLRYDERY